MNFFEDQEEYLNKKSREISLQDKFKNKDIKVIFVSKLDESTDNSVLLKLKSLFQRQLSKMPREYILRQIFDRKHSNLILLDSKNEVIGGVCYRPFYDQNFFEIVFCAVDLKSQVKGIGSFMMDFLKENAKLEIYKYYQCKNTKNLLYKYQNQVINSLDIYDVSYTEYVGNIYFITYADNFAIGYFKKQGFCQKLTFDNWIGYIKDYEGGTLMECNIFWEINYLKKIQLFESKKDAYIRKIKNSTNFYKIYANAEYNTDIEKVPGVTDDMKIYGDKRKKANCLYGFLQLMLNVLKNDINSWPFLEPVSAKDVPEYYKTIKFPMDLSQINTKLNESRYENLDGFVSDIHLMLNNCLKFNAKDTQYYKCAQNLFAVLNERLSFYEKSLQRWDLWK